MDIYGKSFSLFAAALFTALPFASVRADDALADLVPAYHFAFDGDCAQASDASETSFAFGGENPSDATYYRSTRTGENGKALCVTSGSAHPWNSSISTGGGDFTVVCSVRSGTFDRGSLWCVGDKTRGLSLVTHGPAKVGLGNWYDNAFYAKWDDGKDSTALIDVPTAASEFHTYAVVYHSASGNGTADIYVDGVKKGVANDIAINSTTPLQIGGVYGGGDISYRAQSALIDDWRLYRTALADAQIAEYATAFPVQQTAVDNTWTATEEGAWSDVANWSTGSVPSATDTVEIPSGAIITLNGDKSVDTVIIAGDGEATFKPSGNNWSKLQPERIVTSGTATLVLESHYNASNARGAVGIEARGDKPIVIEAPVVLRDSTNSTSQDSWFKGQSATSYIYVQNSLTVESGYLLVYGRTVFNGDLSVNTKFATSNSGNQPRYNQINGKLSIVPTASCYIDSTTSLNSTFEVPDGDSFVFGQDRLNFQSITSTLTKGLDIGANASVRMAQGVTLEEVAFAENAKLYIMVSDAESAAVTIGTVNLPDDGSILADHIIAIDSAGARTPYTISRDDATGDVTAAAGTTVESTEPVTTTWIGGTSADWWNNTNWTLGRPYEKDTAILPVDLTITPGDITISNLVIATGKTLFIKRSGGWPTLRVYETNGGTIRLSCNGLKPQTSVGSEGADIRSDVVVDPTSAGANQDCWIEGNSADSPLNFYGTLYATNSAFRVNQNMNLYGTIVCGYTSDNDNYFNNSVVKSGGEIRTVDGGYATLNAASTVEVGGKVNAEGGKLKLNGGITINGEITGTAAGVVDFGGPATINGNITGSPVVLANGSSGTFALNGDNSEFAGVFSNRTYNLAVAFNNASAGSAKAKWTIYGDAKATSLTEGTLKFGELNYYKDGWCVFYFSDSDDCSLVVEVGELGTDCSFSAAGDCWFGKSSNNNQTPNVKLVKKGAGTMQFGMNRVKFLEIAGGTVSMTSGMFPTDKVTFSGGTLAFTSDDSVNADRSERFSSENTGPISIDTAGHNMTMAAALSTSGAVVKNGEGALTLSAMPTCSGVTVNGGMLILPIDTTTELGTVSVAEGAKLLADGSGLSVTENTPVAIFTGTADADSLGRIGVVGADWNWTASFADGTISANPVAWGDVPNVWVGGAQGYWKDALNWSRGCVPQATHTVKFTSDAFVWIDANKDIGELVVENTAAVTFKYSTGNPAINLTGASGNGTIKVSHVGLMQRGSADATIAGTLTLEYQKLNSANDTDGWVGNVGGHLLNIYAPITGDGFIRIYDKTRLYGDNSSFTGRVRKDDSDARFMTPESGFSNANKIDIYGTLWLWFDEGMISLGGNVNMEASGNRGINMPASAATSENGVTLVLGGGDGTVKMTQKNNMDYQFYTNESNWQAGCANATIRKVGVGTMTCRVVGAYNCSVEGGTVEFAADNASANVSVATGATISGNVTLGTVAFAPGAILAPTVTYTAAVPAVEDDPETEENESADEVPASWTVSTITATEASVQDLIVRLDNDSIAALANIPGERPLVLSASTLNGKPTRIAQDANGDAIAADGSNIWLVRRGASGVTLTAGRQNPGLKTIFR